MIGEATVDVTLSNGGVLQLDEVSNPLHDYSKFHVSKDLTSDINITKLDGVYDHTLTD